MTDSYIGVPPQSGFITTAKQRVTSSTNNYVDLDHSISSLADVIVWVNFVKQDSTNLSLTTSSRITLGATLVASDIVEIAYLGKAVATQTPSASSVTDAMITGLSSSKLSGVVPTANLGSGTASSSTVLYGDQTFKTAPSGALNFITEASSSSNHSEVVFDNCFTSTYENYLIIGDITVTNTGDTARARLKSASGQLDGSQYTYRFQRYEADSNTQGNDTRATSDSYFQLTEGLNNDAARVSYTFKMHIFDPISSTKRMGLRQESIALGNSAVLQSIDGAGHYKDQVAITGILFYPSGNNFSNSTIRIYGISNS